MTNKRKEGLIQCINDGCYFETISFWLAKLSKKGEKSKVSNILDEFSCDMKYLNENYKIVKK